LDEYGIVGFVAHQDIQPTREWEQEILLALRSMEAFLAVHTKGFAESPWTQQEIGFAIARGVSIVSVTFGEAPTGFLSKHQAILREGRTAEEIAKQVHNILCLDERTGLLQRGLSPHVPADPDGIPFDEAR